MLLWLERTLNDVQEPTPAIAAVLHSHIPGRTRSNSKRWRLLFAKRENVAYYRMTPKAIQPGAMIEQSADAVCGVF
jgi:hypothetical protein